MFFPDISAELLKRRKVFDSVKKELASLAIPSLRYDIIHPAELLVTVSGERHIYDTAQGAEALARALKGDSQATATGETT